MVPSTKTKPELSPLENPSILTLTFYPQSWDVEDEEDALSVRITEQLTGPITHCDMVFPKNDKMWGQEMVRTFTIVEGSDIQNASADLFDKQFNRGGFIWIRLDVTPEEIQAVYDWCLEIHHSETYFGYTLMNSSILPFGSFILDMFGLIPGNIRRQERECKRQNSSPYFCSMLCVAALQAAGYLKGRNPKYITPNDLYILATLPKEEGGLGGTVMHKPIKNKRKIGEIVRQHTEKFFAPNSIHQQRRRKREEEERRRKREEQISLLGYASNDSFSNSYNSHMPVSINTSWNTVE
ncbi:MAG: hypothetical protein ACTSUE_05135 [Promethearchaeota archaeon]